MGSKVEEIEQEIFTGLYDKIGPLVESEVSKLENIVSENLDGVEDTAVDDLEIIQKAKQLGMHSEVSDDTESVNAVEIVENKLNALKENLENSFQQVITASEKQLINLLNKVTKDVEKEVFKRELMYRKRN